MGYTSLPSQTTLTLALHKSDMPGKQAVLHSNFQPYPPKPSGLEGGKCSLKVKQFRSETRCLGLSPTFQVSLLLSVELNADLIVI